LATGDEQTYMLAWERAKDYKRFRGRVVTITYSDFGDGTTSIMRFTSPWLNVVGESFQAVVEPDGIGVAQKGDPQFQYVPTKIVEAEVEMTIPTLISIVALICTQAKDFSAAEQKLLREAIANGGF
jgi:hypothetical protein